MAKSTSLEGQQFEKKLNVKTDNKRKGYQFTTSFL